jgi:hypothetical protein
MDQYDAAGSLSKESKGASAETWTCDYHIGNELIWVEKRATDGGTKQLREDMTYDAKGNRATYHDAAAKRADRHSRGEKWRASTARPPSGIAKSAATGFSQPVAAIIDLSIVPQTIYG